LVTDPAIRGGMIRARQRRATFTRWPGSIDKRERAIQVFGEFLRGFVQDLNHRSEEGWSILVEGKRDEMAIKGLGYGGLVVTVSAYSRRRGRAFGECSGVIVLTDLDREGATLASRFVKALSHDGLSTSLAERKRLKAASRGVFLHIENLSRFAETEGYRRGETESL